MYAKIENGTIKTFKAATTGTKKYDIDFVGQLYIKSEPDEDGNIVQSIGVTPTEEYKDRILKQNKNLFEYATTKLYTNKVMISKIQKAFNEANKNFKPLILPIFTDKDKARIKGQELFAKASLVLKKDAINKPNWEDETAINELYENYIAMYNAAKKGLVPKEKADIVIQKHEEAEARTANALFTINTLIGFIENLIDSDINRAENILNKLTAIKVDTINDLENLKSFYLKDNYAILGE